eukprot:scaffold2739_cov257-Pinguiococcus_pyrenoidosus.AAC.40
MLVFGHRGSSFAAPELTGAAIARAFDIDGVDGVEVDVRLSRDGALVLLHDRTLRRTGLCDDARLLSTPVEELTMDELRRVDVGAWKGPEFRGEHVLSLEEAVQMVPEGCKCLVELKSGDAKIVEALARSSVASSGKILVIGFDLELVAAVKRRLPRVACLHVQRIHPVRLFAALGLDLYSWYRPLFSTVDVSLLDRVQELGLDGIDVPSDGSDETLEYIREAKRRGLLVATWPFLTTLTQSDTEPARQWAERAGVDIFVSDLPPKPTRSQGATATSGAASLESWKSRSNLHKFLRFLTRGSRLLAL